MEHLTTVTGTTVEVLPSMAHLITVMGSITRHHTIAKQGIQSGEQAGQERRSIGVATMRPRAVSEASLLRERPGGSKDESAATQVLCHISFADSPNTHHF